MSFGESHGSAVGGVIDGCPAGIALSADFIQGELNRRRPGQSEVSTPRKEEDTVEIFPEYLKENLPACRSDFW